MTRTTAITREGREALATMVTKLFELWELSPEDQTALLGLEGRSSDAIARYRRGEPLADNHDLLDRVALLLSIHSSLRMLFPQNREIAYSWLNIPNKAFDGVSPVEVIRRDGLPGMRVVERYLQALRIE